MEVTSMPYLNQFLSAQITLMVTLSSQLRPPTTRRIISAWVSRIYKEVLRITCWFWRVPSRRRYWTVCSHSWYSSACLTRWKSLNWTMSVRVLINLITCPANVQTWVWATNTKSLWTAQPISYWQSTRLKGKVLALLTIASETLSARLTF